VQHVKDLGLGENTLIFFLGDNGSDAPLLIENNYSSSSPLKGKKGNHWEGGMRVPFIASWVIPNENVYSQEKLPIAQNAIQQQIASVLDIFSTLCKLANVNLPEGFVVDGFDLQEQLMGKQNETRDELFLNHFPHGNHRTNYFTSLVKLDWKIIYHYQVDKEPRYELFNLKEDPFETNNMADENPEQLKRMILTLADEMKNKKARYPEKDGELLKLIIPGK